MAHASYDTRRNQLRTYFDHTAVDAWKRLTSEAPVSGIRATVRAGRERMRQTLLDWLPDDLRGARVLDAGCGTGAFSLEAAGRGADVIGVDLSPKLIQVASQAAENAGLDHLIRFESGDMRGAHLKDFDYIIAMDALIHYRAQDIADVLADFGTRSKRAILFTFAPRTALLATMHTVGKVFPRSDRAPAIEPVSEKAMRRTISGHRGLADWRVARTLRVNNGFYISQAMELTAK